MCQLPNADANAYSDANTLSADKSKACSGMSLG